MNPDHLPRPRSRWRAMFLLCCATCAAFTARTVYAWHNTPTMPYEHAAAALRDPATTPAHRRLAIQVLQATATKIVQQLREEPSEREQAAAAVAQIAKASSE